MKKRNILAATIIGILLFYQIGSFSQQRSTGFTPLIEQAWKAINDKYFDTSFNGVNWQQVREGLRLQKHSTQLDAYATIRSMLQQLNNPAVRFLTPEQTTAFTQEVSGASHSGIGLAELLSVDTSEQSRKITVVTPIPETPAARAGLQPDDVIGAVDGISTEGMSLTDVAMRLRGNPKAQVRLTILRSNQKLDITIQREIVQMPVIRSAIKSVVGKKIGYIALYQFTKTSAQEMQKAMNDMLNQGAEAFVLDLRNNPGGDVAVGKKIAGMFLGAKPMATVLNRGGEITQMAAEGEQLTSQPLSILVNRGTASMAEVLASALQENRRAKIIGVKTFGKSLIQTLENLSDKSALAIPVGQIRTLQGQEILNNGITPDIIANLSLSPILNPTKIEAASEKDTQFQKAAGSALGLK
jgi:carboxyl-terminal processing protease